MIEYIGYALFLAMCGGRSVYLGFVLWRTRNDPPGEKIPVLWGYRRQAPAGSFTTLRKQAQEQLLLFVILSLIMLAMLIAKIA